MSEPYEPDNDALDFLACLGVIVAHCPSTRTRGIALGLLQAHKTEIASGAL